MPCTCVIIQFYRNLTRYGCQFYYGLSGHIDVHPVKNWFNFVSYLGTPFFDKTVNYSLGVFSKNGVKILIAHTLPEYTSIYNVVA